MMESVFLVGNYQSEGILIFQSIAPENYNLNALQEWQEASDCVHEFPGRTLHIWVVTPIQITREHALSIAGRYADTRAERIVDWTLMNQMVPEETRAFLKKRFEQTHKLKAKKKHHDTHLSNESTQGEG